MKKALSEKLEAGRLRHGPYASTAARDGACGAFVVVGPIGRRLAIMASDGRGDPAAHGWEHVSVSTPKKTPTWHEMSFVKDLFWDEFETVIQFHPPRAQWVNNHDYCLHLWRDPNWVAPGSTFRLPPSYLVGARTEGVIRSPADAERVRAAADVEIDASLK
jgi:hypothetical protein